MGKEKSSILLLKNLLTGIGVLPLTDGHSKWIDRFMIEVPIPIIDKLETLLYITASIHIVSNQAILILKSKAVKILIEDIENLYNILYENENNASILNKWSNRGKRQAYFFISTYIVYTCCNCLMSILHLLIFNVYKSPYSIGTLFVPKDLKALAMVFQVFTMFFGTLIMSIHMSFICIIGTSIAGGMEVLKKELQARSTTDNRDFHLFSYKLHSQIINLTARFNKIYGFPLAILTAFCSIQCCLTTYPLARANVRAQDFVLFCTTNVFPVAICETGNAVFTESNNVFLATYDNYWYNESPKSRKELSIMMLVARRPLHLHFRHVVRFTYETYLSILQTSYSYMAVLRTMERS
ncbi:putative odorant receptor 69a isoform X2 [Cimex lectularius]|uniref:Odorant receptor n=1 Tax=Cimex lectularius TaxID=79782 RepID=A0A8I6RG93_CIMLE|nr:putative odorant receptor 69a isoform X2 [Cimex lectularius]